MQLLVYKKYFIQYQLQNTELKRTCTDGASDLQYCPSSFINRLLTCAVKQAFSLSEVLSDLFIADGSI